MKNINKTLALITYPFKENFNVSKCIIKLNTRLENITILNWITEQLQLKIEQRDFIVKFKKFT